MDCRVSLIAFVLAFGCTSEAPSPEQRSGPSPEPPAPVVEAEPTPEPEPDPRARERGCAEVGVGLDLRALPVGSDQQDIRYYTQGQASAFEQLAPAGVDVELRVATGGVSTFDAQIRAPTDSDALGHCRAMIEAFIPEVPGHPRSDESGGSVTSPCRPCEAETRDAG